MKTPIELLRLSNNSYNALIRHGIEDIQELRNVIIKDELRGLRNVGVTKEKEIVEKMKEYL